MNYAQKSFSPFLKSRRAHFSAGAPRGFTHSQRLLEILAQEGPSRVSALFERSGLDPVTFAETLESMDKAKLISTKETADDQIVELTTFGRRMTPG